MREFCEKLESRTLFSRGLGAVTAEYQTLVGDEAVLKADYKSAAATYKADSKLIAADIKALGRNKINSTDIASLNKAGAAAIALDTKDANKIISVGRAALNRAKAAFLADVAHPTAAKGLRLSIAITALTTALAPFEATLGADVATGDANVAAAFAVLVAANPTDTTLSTDVSTAETNSSTALAAITSEVVIINNDIDTLAGSVE